MTDTSGGGHAPEHTDGPGPVTTDGPELSADLRSPVPRVELTDIECRVLGSLIEKEFLTPDVYPMTTNALVSACNQKTNRDPVVDYGPVMVDGALLELRQRQLVRRVHMPGSRSTKHRQALGEILALGAAELAVLSVLLLRGPQTVGELRLRTERQHGFDDLHATEACLEGLANRPIPLVEQLERQPGHKEARWQQLLGDTAQLHPAPGGASDQPDVRRTQTSDHDRVAPDAGRDDQPAAPRSELVERVAALEADVETLRSQLRRLAGQLGESLD